MPIDLASVRLPERFSTPLWAALHLRHSFKSSPELPPHPVSRRFRKHRRKCADGIMSDYARKRNSFSGACLKFAMRLGKPVLAEYRVSLAELLDDASNHTAGNTAHLLGWQGVHV